MGTATASSAGRTSPAVPGLVANSTRWAAELPGRLQVVRCGGAAVRGEHPQARPRSTRTASCTGCPSPLKVEQASRGRADALLLYGRPRPGEDDPPAPAASAVRSTVPACRVPDVGQDTASRGPGGTPARLTSTNRQTAAPCGDGLGQLVSPRAHQLHVRVLRSGGLDELRVTGLRRRGHEQLRHHAAVRQRLATAASLREERPGPLPQRPLGELAAD